MPLLDGPALAQSLHVSPTTIRAWASAGLITRRGRGAHGRNLYDVDEVIAIVQSGTRGVGRLRTTRGKGAHVMRNIVVKVIDADTGVELFAGAPAEDSDVVQIDRQLARPARLRCDVPDLSASISYDHT